MSGGHPAQIHGGAPGGAQGLTNPGAGGSRTALHVALLLLAGSLVFANSLKNGFHLDDFYRVVRNHEIERVWPPWRHFIDPRTSATLPHLVQYRPLLPLSLSLNEALCRWTGLDRSAGFHLGNLAIHLATSVLFYLLCVELLSHWSRAARPHELALGAALLFAVHPVSGVPVNYVCARDLLMMMLFLVGSLLVYARMRRRGGSIGGWTAALGLLALSLLAKQHSVMAPALVLAFEVLLARRPLTAPDAWARALAFGAVVVAFFVWTEIVLDFSDLDRVEVHELSRWIYALTMLEVHLFHYLRNFVWPFRLRPLPSVEPAAGLADLAVLAGALVVFGSLAVAFALRRRQPLLSWCVLAYWLLFVPTSSIIRLRYLATDYHQYPSLAFLCLAVVLALSWLPRRGLQALLVAVLAAYFGASAHRLNELWTTGERLWGQSVRYGGTAMAHLNYARSVELNDPDTAERHYRETLRLSPANVYAHVNLGLLYIRQGRGEEGLESVRRAVALVPDWAMPHYYLARAYGSLGRSEEALAELRQAADIDPRNAEYQYEAALGLQLSGDLAASLVYLERLARDAEGYRDSGFLHGWALHALGRWEEAERVYRAFLTSQPGHGQARFNLAHGLMEARRHRQAIEEFGEVLRRQPDNASAHHWLSLSYEALGEHELAERHAALYRERSR